MPTHSLEDSLLEPSRPLLFSKLDNRFAPYVWSKLREVRTLGVGGLREWGIPAPKVICSLRTHFENIFLERDKIHFSQAKSPFWEPEYTIVNTSPRWPKSCVTECPQKYEARISDSRNTLQTMCVCRKPRAYLIGNLQTTKHLQNIILVLRWEFPYSDHRHMTS